MGQKKGYEEEAAGGSVVKEEFSKRGGQSKGRKRSTFIIFSENTYSGALQ